MHTTFNVSTVILSVAVSFLGSYFAISLCEQYRQSRIGIVESRLWSDGTCCLIVMAICLGGVGIWCMHFIGMSAMTMSDNNEAVEIRYDIGLTILSLVIVLFFSGLGFYISSHDEIFSKTRKEILQLFENIPREAANKPVHMIKIISIHNPKYLIGGGFVAGSGAVLMHYIGMSAMVFKGRIVLNWGIVAASCVIAFVAATAAFWILFRLLSLYPRYELLRWVCALVMALAVCGMHYVGMAACSYDLDDNINVDRERSICSDCALHVGVAAAAMVSFLAAALALSELRYSVWRLSHELSRADETVLVLPINNPVDIAKNIRKYIAKRKASHFNLGMLKDEPSISMDELDEEAEFSLGSSWVDREWGWDFFSQARRGSLLSLPSQSSFFMNKVLPAGSLISSAGQENNKSMNNGVDLKEFVADVEVIGCCNNSGDSMV